MSTTPPDLGHRVAALAAEVTPAEVAELLAVRLANMHPEQVPTHPAHWEGDGIYVRLVQMELVAPTQVPPCSNPGWKIAELTNLGERVLLRVGETAMVATLRMAREVDDD